MGTNWLGSFSTEPGPVTRPQSFSLAIAAAVLVTPKFFVPAPLNLDRLASAQFIGELLCGLGVRDTADRVSSPRSQFVVERMSGEESLLAERAHPHFPLAR